MKYLRFILIAVATVFLAYFFFVMNKNVKEDKTQDTNGQQQNGQNSLGAKTDEQGEVTVKIIPLTLDGQQSEFDVVLDTHSIELDQDLMQIAELVDSQGNIYKPIAWKGAGPGGHHREGILVFQPISPTPNSIELKIKNVDGIPERSFKWILK